MKKILSIFGLSLFITFLFVQTIAPIHALAGPMSDSGASLPAPQGGSTGGPNGTLPPSPASQAKIENPLNVNSIQDLIAQVLKFVVNLLAIAGVVYVIWAGLQMVMAQGDPTKLESAKKSFMNAIIGLAIILGAWAIATVVANTINQVTQNNNVTLKPIQ